MLLAMVPLALASAASWQGAPGRPVVPLRRELRVSAAPRAAFVVPELPTNPVAFLALGFGSSWFLAITSSSFRESDLVQQGSKMRAMRKEPPKVRGVRLTPEALAVTQTFSQKYASKELELLWGALLKCYGSKELAMEAVKSNPQILNPSYSFCNTMLESKRVLLSVMSEAEAREVMLLNPAVLQCGPTLDPLGKGEIMGFARLRSAGNQLFPRELRGAIVGAFVAAVAFVVLTSGVEVPEVVAARDAIRPVLGTVLAASFLFTAYAANK